MKYSYMLQCDEIWNIKLSKTKTNKQKKQARKITYGMILFMSTIGIVRETEIELVAAEAGSGDRLVRTALSLEKMKTFWINQWLYIVTKCQWAAYLQVVDLRLYEFYLN